MLRPVLLSYVSMGIRLFPIFPPRYGCLGFITSAPLGNGPAWDLLRCHPRALSRREQKNSGDTCGCHFHKWTRMINASGQLAPLAAAAHHPSSLRRMRVAIKNPVYESGYHTGTLSYCHVSFSEIEMGASLPIIGKTCEGRPRQPQAKRLWFCFYQSDFQRTCVSKGIPRGVMLFPCVGPLFSMY